MTRPAAAPGGGPDPDSGGERLRLHASCVAMSGAGGLCGLLILGAPGAGKSRLSLELISRGARLVADDQTLLRRDGAWLIASAPPSIAGLIEARGVGLIELPALAEAPVICAADLDRAETERLPPGRILNLLGLALPLIFCGDSPGRAAAMAPGLAALLSAGGRRAP